MEVEDCDTDGSFLEAVQPASKRIAALVQKRPKNFELFIIQSPLIPNKIITSVVGVLQKLLRIRVPLANTLGLVPFRQRKYFLAGKSLNVGLVLEQERAK